MLVKCLMMILSMDQLALLYLVPKWTNNQVKWCVVTFMEDQNFHHFHPPQHLLCFFHTNVHTQLLEVWFCCKVQCNCTSIFFGLLQKLQCLPSCLTPPFFSIFLNSFILNDELMSELSYFAFKLVIMCSYVNVYNYSCHHTYNT